jgi:hypothetical protein
VATMIELLDFDVRGGEDAPAIAMRVARITERYLAPERARDAMAVVNEIVTWAASADPAPRRLRLELSVTPTTIRITVWVGRRFERRPTPRTNAALREIWPVTAALATRYGVEANQRTRAWAEFDRVSDLVPPPATRTSRSPH